MLRLKQGHSDGVVDNLYNYLIGRSNNVSFENHIYSNIAMCFGCYKSLHVYYVKCIGESSESRRVIGVANFP